MRATQADDSEPSPVVTFLKVVAGGALALPIAYLIVMWVFARDPLGIGEQVGERIPFVVPASLRADSEDDENPDSQSEGLSGLDSGFGSSSPSVIDSGFDSLNIGEEALQDFDQ